MDKRDPVYIFQQIHTHAVEAVEICQGKSRKDPDEDRSLNLALTRLLEIIGEAQVGYQIRFEQNTQVYPGCR